MAYDKSNKNKQSASQRNFLFLELVSRLYYPLALLFLTLVFGTIGYYIIGIYLDQNWTLLDCILMTSITLTTVGYGDVFASMHSKVYEIYTISLMWVGMGVTLYSISTITAFIVEKHLARYFKERKMRKKIDALKGHYILCGAGNTGIHILRELTQTLRDFVVIEQSAERIAELEAQFPEMLFIVGDATKEEVLREAGIDRAGGIIASLATDSLNLLLTVTARYMDKNIRIVARCIDHSLADKLILSGANSVISPNFIGGMRMASEMIRPHVVGFLDKMLRGSDKSIRFEEIPIGEKSDIAGKALRDTKIFEKTGLNIVAVEKKGSNEFLYNPGGDTKVEPGDVLVAIGNANQVKNLREICCK